MNEFVSTFLGLGRYTQQTIYRTEKKIIKTLKTYVYLFIFLQGKKKWLLGNNHWKMKARGSGR